MKTSTSKHLDYVFENLQITVVILSLPTEEQIHAIFGDYEGDEMTGIFVLKIIKYEDLLLRKSKSET